MKMPRNIGPVHFIGIGGIGMSGIAEILHNQGYVVQGSDMAANPNVQRLRDMGITVEIGQSGDNLGKAEVVVVSSAIKKDNPELMAARARARWISCAGQSSGCCSAAHSAIARESQNTASPACRAGTVPPGEISASCLRVSGRPSGTRFSWKSRPALRKTSQALRDQLE